VSRQYGRACTADRVVSLRPHVVRRHRAGRPKEARSRTPYRKRRFAGVTVCGAAIRIVTPAACRA